MKIAFNKHIHKTNTDSNITPNVNHVSKSSNLDNRSIIENSTDAVIPETLGNSTLSLSPDINKINGDKKLKVKRNLLCLIFNF